MENRLSSGRHPGIKVSVETGPAQTAVTKFHDERDILRRAALSITAAKKPGELVLTMPAE